jgi:hypothetical protein
MYRCLICDHEDEEQEFYPGTFLAKARCPLCDSLSVEEYDPDEEARWRYEDLQFRSKYEG